MAQRDRIASEIKNSERTTLAGHVPPVIQHGDDLGPVSPSLALSSLRLTLRPSGAQQTALDQLLAAQQDPSSTEYRRWLTPEEYADRFGASSDDISKITAWLEQQGFKVTNVARARNSVSFSGTAAQVQSAFGIELHNYAVRGETYFANSTDPSIPAALVPVVQSIRGLHNFRMKPLLKARAAASATFLSGPVSVNSTEPAYTSSTGNHYMSPDDFTTIYDVKPLYNAGMNGAGQKIIVAGQTQINISDIEQFRSKFNLPTNDPQVLLVPNTQDPGISKNDLPEADLDLEWSGAVAPNASITFVYTSDVMDAVQYAIDQNIAPVLSVSYGSCEPETPESDALTFQSWAEQGNAQGMTWVSAAGDSGGADCLNPPSTTDGIASVDVPASIPQVTGMGGSEFNETTGQYWNATNNVNGGSAVGYIPETVWNDSTTNNPAAGGGGASVYFLQPPWQTGPGVPSDNARNVPDISLNASAEHDGYMVYTGGQLQIYGGTSVAAPSFAGIATLLNQYLVTNGTQASPGLGNVNPKLYSLAQTTPGAFHDITSGNNLVTLTCTARARNCVSGSYGFNAAAGYDQASGLGSIDANNLVLAWAGKSVSIAKTTPTLSLSSSTGSISASGSVTVTGTVRSSNGGTPTGTLSFYLGGVSLGTATLFGSGGTATASLSVSGAQLQVGADTITAQYSGDTSYNGASASVAISVTSSSSGAPTIGGLTNGASFKQAFAPGMVLSVFGSSLAPAPYLAGTVPLPKQLAGVSATIDGITAPLYYVSSNQLNIQIPYEVPANNNAQLVVNNNGQTISTTFPVATAAPGIFTDSNGRLVQTNSAKPGDVITMYITGQGAVSPTIATGAAPPPGTSVANLPGPVLPTSVTIGGINAPIQFVGIPIDLVGVTQINLQVPPNVGTGQQPVVVTVGGVPSPTASITIQ